VWETQEKFSFPLLVRLGRDILKVLSPDEENSGKQQRKKRVKCPFDLRVFTHFRPLRAGAHLSWHL
jgi:hypothetical protein